jgi:hypothetical protein
MLFGPTAASAQLSKPIPIQDNSFLVEEAYNQERGVVQHVSTFARPTDGRGWAYTFTQEWPVRGQRHQLSYTVAVTSVPTSDGTTIGLGDAALNYRYQIGSSIGPGVAIAPRASVLLPTGSSRRTLGAGGPAIQLNLPLSAALHVPIVFHSNVGATYTPRERNALGDRAATVDYTLGQSAIWLFRPKLNFMVETTWSRTHEVVASGQTARMTDVLLSPGIRGAIDFPSGLQVVPGIAVPIGVGPSRGTRSVFIYLSFEHGFTGDGE